MGTILNSTFFMADMHFSVYTFARLLILPVIGIATSFSRRTYITKEVVSWPIPLPTIAPTAQLVKIPALSTLSASKAASA